MILKWEYASFALAFSITNMILGFFMYTHQLVLQFYKHNKRKVIKFLIFVSILPTLLLCLLCYTPVGLVYMRVIMGADEALSLATIAVLKFFIIKTLVFPWVDFLNGFLMLNRQTNKMLLAQIGKYYCCDCKSAILRSNLTTFKWNKRLDCRLFR